MDDEKVMCFPAKILNQLGMPENGYSKDIDKYFFGILKQENIFFVERSEAENNENFKQIIPYQILKSGNRYFVYRRGSKGNESRLYKNLSVGIGGHINDGDIGEATTAIGIYSNGSIRERDEEVQMPDIYHWWTLGCIYDNFTKLGRVHFGFASLFDLGENLSNFKIKDDALDFVGWWTKEDLQKNYNKFEKWSQIVVDHLL